MNAISIPSPTATTRRGFMITVAAAGAMMGLAAPIGA